MENKLINQLESVLPEEISIPTELKSLYQWIEENKFYTDDDDGKRIGFLCSKNEFRGTLIEFGFEEKDVWYWFDENRNIELKKRFCTFATSADGSICGLWKSDNNEIKVVHIGSGSGSTLLCVLANNMLDFIRLLAIGYKEICWEEKFSTAPRQTKKNIFFQNWVRNTFNVDIPKNGLEIVKYPSTMEDEHSKDEFFNWCKGKFSFLE